MLLEKAIAIIGVDGSGKTRHARKLLSEFSRSGRKCKYVWLRSVHFFSLPFMALCRLLGFAMIHDLHYGQTYTEHLYYKRPVALVWTWIQLVDVLLFIVVKIYIPFILGYLLVLDRFVHDIIIDLMNDVNDSKLYKSFVGQLILRLVPPKTIILLFDVDEKTALQRKSDIPNMRYLMTRRRYYQIFARDLKISMINTQCSFDLAHKNLLRKIQESRSLLAYDYIERQLLDRLYKRARWKKYKKGPVAIFRRLIKKICYRLFGVHKAYAEKMKLDLDLGVDEFGRNVTRVLLSYTELLKRRGLNVQTILVVGSRAKGRWKPESDVDTIIIACGVPKGLKRYFVLSDIPLFLGPLFLGGVPDVFTKEDFLLSLEKLDLKALDAVYYGKIVFDNGFWPRAKKRFNEIEEKYELRKIRLKLCTI